jgi:hypothetical protein
MGQFDLHEKSAATYLDKAANGSGVDKCGLTVDALTRLQNQLRPRQMTDIVEIGPGGGIALEALTGAIKTQLPAYIGKLSLRLLELDGIESESLRKARRGFGEIGESTLHVGDAREIDRILGQDSSDVIVACAVLHEVYSYGGGLPALKDAFCAANDTLREGGYMAYRDIVSVPGESLLDRRKETFHSESWVRFSRMFLPYYLKNAQHPYGAEQDQVSFEQGLGIVSVDDVDPVEPVTINAPIGVFRELQRHYITFRDHAWRSDAFEVAPVLDGPFASDWVDERQGRKRIHFRFNSEPGDNPLSEIEETDSEGNYVADCDVFDPAADLFLAHFLEQANKPGTEQSDIWKRWVDREGPETYVYYTLDNLIGAVAAQTFDHTGGKKMLLPRRISVSPRAYYTRYLKRNLERAFVDGGQQVLFQAINPRTRPDLVEAAMTQIVANCSENTVNQVHGTLA